MKCWTEVAMAFLILMVLCREIGIILFNQVFECIPTTASDGSGRSSCSSRRSLLLLLRTRWSLGVHWLRRRHLPCWL
jgi:hypothetical protein